MKEKILFLLKESTDYISGETISKELGITRTSVWKHINALKRDGYNIEGISKKGYILNASLDIFNILELKSKLNKCNLISDIKHFNQVSSTNIIAKDLAIKNAPHGTLVISDTQTLGKGRLGREWISPKGGIWSSLILRPNLDPIEAPKLTQIAAAALSLTLKAYGINAKIKWPNDLLIDNKKICGILTEMSCDMDSINYVIVGIGINVNLSNKDIPIEIQDKASSLYLACGKFLERSSLFADFLKNFEKLYNDFLENPNTTSWVNICRKNSALIGKEIIISTRNGDEKVTFIDITNSGELLIKDPKGNERTACSGEISLSKNYN